MLRKLWYFVLSVLSVFLVGLSPLSPASAQVQWSDTIRLGLGHSTDVVNTTSTTMGDLYVLSSVTSPSGAFPGYMVVTKYDVLHQMQWRVAYQDPNGGTVEPTQLQMFAYDTLMPDLFALATVTNTDGTTNLVILRLNHTTGQTMWKRVYVDPVDSHARAFQLYLNFSGSLYVLDTAFARVLYTVEGIFIRTRRFTGRGDVRPAGMATNNLNGNLFEIGTAASARGDQDYLTFIDGGDDFFWYHLFDGPTGTADYARDIAVDSHDNVYVTGEMDADVATVVGTVKYDITGNRIWARRFGELVSTYGPGSADSPHIALDSQGNVIVAGRQVDDQGTNIFVVKYDPQGNELWHQRYDKEAGHSNNVVGVAVDSHDNIVVLVSANEFAHPGPLHSNNYIVTLKYRPDNSKAWIRTYTGATLAQEYPQTLKIGAGDVVYVGGKEAIASISRGIILQYAP